MSLPLNWPVSLDALANPGPTTERDDAGFELDLVVSRIHDLLEAMEARFGVGTANGTPVADRVYGGTGAGTAGYRQVANNDLSGGIGLTKLVHVGAGNVLRSDGTQNVGGQVQAADIVAGAFPSRIGAVVGPFGTAQASFDWSSIPTAYTHLMLMLWIRSTAAVGEDVVLLKFNANSAGYYTQRSQAAATSVAGAEFLSETYARIGAIPGANAASTLFSPVIVNIPGYRATAGDKAWISQVLAPDALSSGNIVLRHSAGIWDSGAAITGINVQTAASIAIGSVACLYGFN